MQVFPTRAVPFTFALLLLAGGAFAQGGGFVFDEPEAPAKSEVPAPLPPKPAEAEPEDDDLEDFSFGGASKPTEATATSGKELGMWEDTRTADTPEAYRAYLDAFPEGQYAEAARNRLAEFQAAADRREGLVSTCDRMAGDPEDPGLSEGAAGVAVASIDADAALWTCSRARAAAPDLPRLSYNMGRISENQGQRVAALGAYRTAMMQSIEQTGNPYLPAANGILRLSDPRGGADQMANALLQLALDNSARVEALRTRVAELDAALAVTTADAAESAVEVEALLTEIETLTAREMDLSNALAGAEEQGQKAAALGAEIAALRTEVAQLTADLAAARDTGDAAASEAERLRAELATANETAKQAAALEAERNLLAAEIAATEVALQEALDAATRAAADAAAQSAERDALAAEIVSLKGELEDAIDNAMIAASEASALRAEMERLAAENAELSRNLETSGND